MRNTAAGLGTLLALLLGIPGSGRAQQTVGVGSLVRIGMACTEIECPRLQGRLLRATADSVSIDTRDIQLTVPVHDIAWMEVGRNRHGVRKGALIGAGFGVLTGLVMMGDICEGSCSDGESGLAYFSILLFNGAIWGGIGALVGAVAAPTKWTPVPPTSVRLTVRPSLSGGLGVGATIPLPALRLSSPYR